MTEDPLPAEGWHPPYEFRNLVTSGAALFIAACLAGYSAAERSAWAAIVAGAMTLLAVIVMASTVVCVKSDRCRREMATRVDQATSKREEMRVELTKVSGVCNAMSGELREVGNTVSANSGELEALKVLIGDFVKRYPPAVAMEAFEQQMEELAAQQETLANMVADSSTVTIDVANGDVYELGKRVGRDEALKELGKDPTQ